MFLVLAIAFVSLHRRYLRVTVRSTSRCFVPPKWSRGRFLHRTRPVDDSSVLGCDVGSGERGCQRATVRARFIDEMKGSLDKHNSRSKNPYSKLMRMLSRRAGLENGRVVDLGISRYAIGKHDASPSQRATIIGHGYK